MTVPSDIYTTLGGLLEAVNGLRGGVDKANDKLDDLRESIGSAREDLLRAEARLDAHQVRIAAVEVAVEGLQGRTSAHDYRLDRVAIGVALALSLFSAISAEQKGALAGILALIAKSVWGV